MRAAHRGWLYRDWSSVHDEAHIDTGTTGNVDEDTARRNDDLGLEGATEDGATNNARVEAASVCVQDDTIPTMRSKKYGFVEIKEATQTSKPPVRSFCTCCS